MNFENLEYLKTGNEKQQHIFQVLTKHNVMSLLRQFDAILVGTFPINIDIETSDLDIICCWQNKQEFIDLLQNRFGTSTGFSLRERKEPNQEAVIANFSLDGFEVEIFGQNMPTREQAAYKHMLIEHEILNFKGESFRQQILDLKRKGLKTEPAFGALLGLKNNPYEELLHYVLPR